MPRYPCPVCGDPNAYPLWIDPVPPSECFYNPKATNVTECPEMMARAAREARRRRLAPHCFDSNGNLIPGKSGEVLEAEWDAAAADARAMQERWKKGVVG